jgi:hypothetical protein
LVQDEEHLLGPGGCACAPPGVVHGFRSTSPARFLNFHTPDGGFADNLRDLDRGGRAASTASTPTWAAGFLVRTPCCSRRARASGSRR